jgi:hypothetical protein
MGRGEYGAKGRLIFMLALVQFAMSAVTGAISGTLRARTEMEQVAQRVAQTAIREEWLRSLQVETVRIAKEAAAQAAEEAVRETVVPVAIDAAKHRAMDEQWHRDAERRLDQLENWRNTRGGR